MHDRCKPRAHAWRLTPLWAVVVGMASGAALAQQTAQTKELGVVLVTSGQPSSLPTQIPTTLESVTAQQLTETVNATDSEDALKYLPSLSVRKRYIGDYNHAVLASRASGANNPARSAVYADGVLLSNYLGNSATNAPRWGLVTPEEIERVDVMYGPFSAAYPGNSVGAVVDYVTRMPQAFEAHMKVSAFNQRFDAYNTDSHFGGANASASLGSRVGDWSYWFNVNRLDSSGQPMMFLRDTSQRAGVVAGSTRVNGVASAVGTNGVSAADVLGTTTQYHTVQDHAKLKLAYDLSSTLRASYLFGYWQNRSDGNPSSYLSHATTGAAVYTGSINNGVNTYAVPAFTASQEALTHTMHGLSLKTRTQEVFDWEINASLYDYATDLNRVSGTQSSDTTYVNAGKLIDQNGSGWRNLALKGTWRPEGMAGAHIVDFGYQQDHYMLKTITQNTGVNWEAAAPTTLASMAGGQTQMQSLYVQDAWRLAPRWKTVLGVRAEDWTASNGYVATTSANTNAYAPRHETHISPKAALSHQWSPDWLLKASIGRSVRMPTAQEMFGNTSLSGASTTFLNDPNLRPERSWTSELTAEKDLGTGWLRLTAFFENTRDAIYSQTNTFSDGTSRAFVQNIKRIESSGLEMAYFGNDVITRGLDLSGSVTYVDSRIKENNGQVAVAGDTLNKYQPRVPAWRGHVLGNYHWSDQLSTSLGARYSGHQFGTLNNADVNGYAMTGVSKFFVVDTRVRYKVDKQWTVAAGIDNLNNYKYWNYHMYPMRTFFGELKYDL